MEQETKRSARTTLVSAVLRGRPFPTRATGAKGTRRTMSTRPDSVTTQLDLRLVVPGNPSLPVPFALVGVRRFFLTRRNRGH